MHTHEPQQFSVEVGSHVRVRQDVTDIAYDDILLEGWMGTVTELDEDMCRLRWSERTLKRMPDEYRERWRGAGLPIDSVWLPQEFVETASSDEGHTTSGYEENKP